MPTLSLKEWLWLVGGSVAVYVVLRRLNAPDPLPSQPSGGGGGIAPPSPSLPPLALMIGSSLELRPGHVYYAAVDIGFPASVAADKESVERIAEEKGFQNVFVTEDAPPPGWPTPSVERADFFVTGTYQGPQTTIAREPGAGVTITEAFVR